MELSASKAVISRQYPRYLDAACAYLPKEVDILHGGAQLENQCKHCKLRISAFGRYSGCGCGRGHYRGRAQERGIRRGRHQGGGSGGRGTQTEINGINVDNLLVLLQMMNGLDLSQMEDVPTSPRNVCTYMDADAEPMEEEEVVVDLNGMLVQSMLIKMEHMLEVHKIM